MTARRHYIYIIAACLFILASFWLVVTVLFTNHTTYITYIQESVSGLSHGARVEYNGVAIGKVAAIRINKNNPKLVDVILHVENDAQITQGTVAMLATSEDQPGRSFIALKDEANNLKPLMLTPGAPFPVIPSVASTKENVNVALTQIAHSLQQFNDTFQLFMNKDEVESFKQLVFSLQQVVGMLAENSQRLNKIIVNTSRASDQFGTFLNSSQATLQSLQNQMLPSTYKLINNMQVLLNRIDALTADIAQNPAVILRGKTPPQPGPDE